MHRDLYKRYCFMKAYAGYCLGRRAIGAIALARAEQWICNQKDYGFVWEDDSYDSDLGDHEYWCSTARRLQAGYNSNGEEISHHYSRYGEQCEHDVESCMLVKLATDEDNYRDRHEGYTDVLASLGGIIDADRDYRRVIEAELALEALDAIRTESTAYLYEGIEV